MPKIEVNEEAFYILANRRWNTRDDFEEALTCAKAELDEDSDKTLPPAERVLKIELNDTNRPDLWGTAGCARQLRVYNGGKDRNIPFFHLRETLKKLRKRCCKFPAESCSQPLLRRSVNCMLKRSLECPSREAGISNSVTIIISYIKQVHSIFGQKWRITDCICGVKSAAKRRARTCGVFPYSLLFCLIVSFFLKT